MNKKMNVEFTNLNLIMNIIAYVNDISIKTQISAKIF